ncbi:MAG: hypothetical protein HRU26_16770 [Psychroserpens sp.]|nr:hypothetical protein [Psychroserpens sp.]
MSRISILLTFVFLLACNTKSEVNIPSQWNYELKYDSTSSMDSLQPLGIIRFDRIRSVPDEQRQNIYKERWFPSMDFEIYPISRLEYCQNQSKHIQFLSSCLKPNVGGDLIINEGFIFLNRSHCLNCIQSENGLDYCRPVIIKILNGLDLKSNSSLEDIDEQLGQSFRTK